MRAPTQPERSFQLAGPPRRPWWLWGLALVLHVPVAVVVVTRVWHHTTTGWQGQQWQAPATPDPTTRHVFLLARPAPPPAADLPAAPLPRGAMTGPSRAEPSRSEEAEAVAIAADPPAGSAVASPPLVGVAAPPAALPVLTPQYGSGVLWGHHPKATAEELARQALGYSSGARIDSATTARLQQFVDSLAREQRRLQPQPPQWTTAISGKTVGLDGQWIYLGPIRVPVAILGLLPIAMPGNPTQEEYTRKLDVMRQDLYIAAGRARNYADFRAAVDKLRAEREAERAFRAAQRRRPSGGNPRE